MEPITLGGNLFMISCFGINLAVTFYDSLKTAKKQKLGDKPIT